MKIVAILILVLCIHHIGFAQENKKSFPQFEDCKIDDQNKQSCFENTLRTQFKHNYRKTEIASDYRYDREVVGSFKIDRRGKVIQSGYDSKESPIFIAIQRAMDKLPRLTPSEDENNRKQDFDFQIKFTIKRSSPNQNDALAIEVDYIYPSEDLENS